MQQIVESIRNWFRSCPELEAGNRFGVDFMGENPTEYAIYVTPSSLASSVDICGNIHIKDEQEQKFIFASREKHSPDVLQALANHGFYDSVINWIIEQNRTKNFPELPDGEVIYILPSMTQYLFEAGSSTGRYQIQCTMKYRRKA